MIKTRLTEMLGIDHPIMEGGMGISQGAAGAAAISNAGACGCVGRPSFAIASEDPGAPPVYRQYFEDMLALTDKPFCANVPVGGEQADRDSLIDVVLHMKATDERASRQLVALVTSGGNGAPLVEPIKNAGLKHFHKVSTVRQALKMEAAGADALIAMGSEAGGHVGADGIGTIVLLPMLVQAVRIPVLGAGGFCDGAGLAAALALGAEGIEVGTRFLATTEWGAPPPYKDAIVRARARDAVLEPGRFGDLRVLDNALVRERRAMVKGKSEHDLTHEERAMLLEHHTNLVRKRLAAGDDFDPECVILAAGQVCGRIGSVESASDVVTAMVLEAETIFQNLVSRLT